MDNALGFYRDLLGFDEVVDEDLVGEAIDAQVAIEDAHLRTVMLVRAPDGPMLELIAYRRPPSTPRLPTARQNDIGCDHLCLLVDDINAEYRRLSDAGVAFTSPPQFIDEGYFEGDWAVFCLDPDGLTVELWQTGTPGRT
jgi:catechol 2,3-dioxygenase-like lactoylglutathione lyase family enzyme